MRKLVVLALLLAFATPGAAEDGQPMTGARYQLTLKTGRTFVGIVRGQSLYEKRVKGHYLKSAKGEKGAGVRLWYPGQQYGYVFLRSLEITKVEMIEEVGEDETRLFAEIRERSRKRAQAERKRLRDEREERERVEIARIQADEDAKKGDAPDEPTSRASKTEAQKLGDYTVLLLKYPPGRWTLKTPENIRHRKTVLGLAPSDEEAAFMAVFDDWKTAYAVWRKAQSADEAKAAEGAGADSVATRK